MSILAIKPVRLTPLKYFGDMGGEALQTDYILSKLITQNILYTSYHEPQSISDIAELVGIEPSLVEEEVVFLEAHGYMDINIARKNIGNKAPPPKFLTSIFIIVPSLDLLEAQHQLASTYAQEFCAGYIPLLLKKMQDFDPKIFYTPENDFNFLFWAITVFACTRKIITPGRAEQLQKFAVLRKDGSQNIVYTSIDKELNTSFDPKKYHTFGPIEHSFEEHGYYPIRSWQFNTFYDNRLDGWGRSMSIDDVMLYGFLKEGGAHQFNYDHLSDDLFQKNLLVAHNGSLKVNKVVLTMTLKELEHFLPPLPSALIDLKQELDDQINKLLPPCLPERMQQLGQLLYPVTTFKNVIISHILEQCLLHQFLKPLPEHQKKTVNMIMAKK